MNIILQVNYISIKKNKLTIKINLKDSLKYNSICSLYLNTQQIGLEIDNLSGGHFDSKYQKTEEFPNLFNFMFADLS